MPTETMIGIDTNVVLRAVLRDDPQQSAIAARLFRELTPSRRGFVTRVTLAETYWVMARAKRLSRDTCLAVIRSLVETEVLEFDDGETVVRALTLAEEGADFADALIQGDHGALRRRRDGDLRSGCRGAPGLAPPRRRLSRATARERATPGSARSPAAAR